MTNEIIEAPIYIKIDRSVNIVIDELEAQGFLKAGTYHTTGKYNERELVIFDLEKNLSLPELRFLDSFVGGQQSLPFNPFGKGFIFLLCIGLIFGYFFLTKDKDEKPETVIETTSFPSSPVTNVLNTNPVVTEPLVDDSQKLALESQISTLSSQLSSKDSENALINNSLLVCQGKVTLLNSQIDFLNQNQAQQLTIGSYSDEKSEIYKEKLATCESENANLLEKNVSIKNSLQSENQLYLKVGKDVLQRCKLKESEFCDDYILNFFE